MGSRPEVGSSRITKSGSLISACARPMRRCIPLENSPLPSCVPGSNRPFPATVPPGFPDPLSAAERDCQKTPASHENSGNDTNKIPPAGIRCGIWWRHGAANARRLQCGPLVRIQQPQEQFNRGRFADPFGPSRTKHFTSLSLQIDIVNGRVL